MSGFHTFALAWQRWCLGLTDPRQANEVPPYPGALTRAWRLSRAAAPTTPEMSLQATQESAQRLLPLIHAAFDAGGVTGWHMQGAAQQCVKWAHWMAPWVAEVSGMAAWPTIGQVWKGNDKAFGYSWAETQDLISRGVHIAADEAEHYTGLQWHAWITLQTGELIDLTLPSTLAKALPNLFSDKAGVIIAGQEPELIRDHRYFPMLVGAPVIELMQERSSVKFLARHVDELRYVDATIVSCEL